MTMSRRTIIKGMAAAPFVTAAGAALAPATAEAATITPGQFTLAERTSNASGAFADHIAGLARALPRAQIADVLAVANRDATRLSSAPAGVGGFSHGFTWNTGDQDAVEWIPQGITTSADALGAGLWPAGGKRVVLVSWYFETDPDDNGVADFLIDKGIRVSFVDYTSAAAPVYRHVLLVEPVRGAGGTFTYEPVRKHAGGIMWYGNRLYVVDTYKGLRVFDLDSILEVSTGLPDACGLQSDGSYHAYDYRFVLPQCGAYDNTGTLLRFSAIGLDRASSPDSLTVSEYATSLTSPVVDYSGTGWNGNGTKVDLPKIVRWPLDYTTRKLAATTATEAVTVKQGKIQGVVSRQSKHYLSQSNGPSSNGYLKTVTSGTDVPSTVVRLGVGSEDLSFHSGTTTDWAYRESVIWNLSEYAGRRDVYAVFADGS
ncbi:hypothetical protein OG765_03170 [Streptomyces sp. NBC_00555]|uniref:hypothetical protein n=1 Tax=Streptomyces sp. NBC_00555 TaxID=2903662 RepID=UPI00225A08F6|nr:hypothetical protein [Streptomyces sp. NBC_00555]MCX5009990.1 hypothetical protein [Streptomyces sp. NBC_00555]